MTPILLTARGMLHRRQPDGRMHPRCAGGRGSGVGLSEQRALEYAEGRPAVLCRYRWCFRAVLVSAGVDPEVGHVARQLRRPTLEQIAELIA